MTGDKINSINVDDDCKKKVELQVANYFTYFKLKDPKSNRFCNRQLFL